MKYATRQDVLFRVSRLRREVKKRAWARFDNNDLLGALRYLDRYNALLRAEYSGEKGWSPGEFLDEYLKELAFEAHL